MPNAGRLAGRVALVTGGSGGIGRALAARLAAEGADPALTYAAHREDAQQAAAVVEAAGRRAVLLEGDLRDGQVPAELAGAVTQTLGPVDVLVANAGLGRPRGYQEVDAAAWDTTLNVNLRAPFLLAQAVLPGMRERHFGRVLFVSSVAAFTGGVVGPDYAASKAGLHGLTHFLAARVAADGVTVNAIAPALIERTRMLPGDGRSPPLPIPVGRFGRPEEVADLAVAMLTNGYLTNQVVSIDGGMHPR